MKKIFIAPVKQTKDFTHYVVHEFVNNGLVLISGDNPDHAKELGLNYNKHTTELPPYTLKVHYTQHSDRLKNELARLLVNTKRKGSFMVYNVNGWVTFGKVKIVIQKGEYTIHN